MSEYLKPQSPLQHKDGAYIYPLTTADQVILENGNRLNTALNDMSSKPKAGFIYPLASSVVPDGFLLCDGAEYSRVQYEELFAAIGTIYGEGDGSTTFNVPNLQTRIPVGAGEGYGLGATGGEAEHTLTVAEMPAHIHTIGGDLNYSGTASGDTHYSHNRGNNYNNNYTNSAGGSQPHNNMQPYTVVNYIIATGKDTGVSVSDIVMGAQALPLGVEYGGTGATTLKDIRHNLGVNARNLLDNSDFRNPVNQRGKTAYTGNVYTIDRWQVWQDTMTVGNGFVKANALFQFLQIPIDKVYTLVACAEDGSKAVVSGMPLNAVSALKDGVSVTLTNIAGYTEPIIGSEKNLIWAALYEGEYTAETLPEYQPKGYAAELVECQRYYNKIGAWAQTGVGAVNYNGTSANIVVPIGVVMRVNPTVIGGKRSSYLRINGQAVECSNAEITANVNGAYLILNVAVDGLTNYVNHLAEFDVGDTDIVFSADL